MKVFIQDTYPEDFAHCYGCGYKNPEGHHFKTTYDEATGETVTRYRPKPYHTAIPGFVYGGLIASLIDCHSSGSAAIFKMLAEGKKPGEEPAPRFVTARLEVDYLKPTPLGPELEVRGRAVEVGVKKVVVKSQLLVEGVETARSRAVMVRIPETMVRAK